MKRKIIIFLISIGIIFSGFVFSAKAEEGKAEVPGTIDEAKAVVMDMIRAAREDLPKSIKSMWDEEVLPIWKRMFDWFNDNIGSKVREIIRQREPEVKQSLEEEKGEMAEDIKKEAPKLSESLKNFWQEIKNLFSKD